MSPVTSAVSQNLTVRSTAIQYDMSPVAVNLADSCRYKEVSSGLQIFFSLSAHIFGYRATVVSNALPNLAHCELSENPEWKGGTIQSTCGKSAQMDFLGR